MPPRPELPAALRTGLRRLLAGPLGLLLSGVLSVSGVVVILGGNPFQALGAIHQGALGTPAAVTESLIRATPLTFTGMGVAIAFRAGIWNIGAEGQLLVGMLACAACGLALPPLPAPIGTLLCLAAAAAAGGAWAGIAAWLRVRRAVPEIISTIMLNFLAVYLVEYLVRGPLRDPQSINDWSRPLPRAVRLPDLVGPSGPAVIGFPITGPAGEPILSLALDPRHLHAGVFLPLLVAAGLWLWLDRSRAGLGLKFAGAAPTVAEAGGLPVSRILIGAMLAGGALAGLGGAVEQLAVLSRLHRFAPGEPGYGFSGIPVALLGNLHPGGVLLSAAFFGALAAGCDRMQRSAGISFQVAYVVQAVLVGLLLLRPPRKPSVPRSEEHDPESGDRGGAEGAARGI